jgi:hypothetical protein
MHWKVFSLVLIWFLFQSFALGQAAQEETPTISALLRDLKEETLEKDLPLDMGEIPFSTQENEEKTAPSKYLQSLILEKKKDESATDPTQEARYSLRLENSQKIYTLRRRYTLSLNTSLGLVTRAIDPGIVYHLFSRNDSPAQTLKSGNDESLIQDRNIFFSLQFTF